MFDLVYPTPDQGTKFPFLGVIFPGPRVPRTLIVKTRKSASPGCNFRFLFLIYLIAPPPQNEFAN